MMNAASSSSSSSSSRNRARAPPRMVEQPHGHVLIVDSSKTIRSLIETKFKKYSWEVSHAESGPDAYQFLGLTDSAYKDALLSRRKRKVTTMVVADYNSGGYELLEKIKKSSRVKDVHVVIMFSAQDPTLGQKCKDAGALMSAARPLAKHEVELLMELIK